MLIHFDRSLLSVASPVDSLGRDALEIKTEAPEGQLRYYVGRFEGEACIHGWNGDFLQGVIGFTLIIQLL
jgi:hypothetical protein